MAISLHIPNAEFFCVRTVMLLVQNASQWERAETNFRFNQQLLFVTTIAFAFWGAAAASLAFFVRELQRKTS